MIRSSDHLCLIKILRINIERETYFFLFSDRQKRGGTLIREGTLFILKKKRKLEENKLL